MPELLTIHYRNSFFRGYLTAASGSCRANTDSETQITLAIPDWARESPHVRFSFDETIGTILRQLEAGEPVRAKAIEVLWTLEKNRMMFALPQ